MLSIVNDTKTNKIIENSAAAAITAINLYIPSLSGMDLSNISIPRADLSCTYL